MLYKVEINTRARAEFQEVTATIQKMVADSGVKSGICHLFVPHTTAGITINEHADPDVIDDIATHLENMVPWQANYRHAEGNSAAHIKASLMGSSQQLLIEEGKLVLGVWQGIFFSEFDGPRRRTLLVKISADRA